MSDVECDYCGSTELAYELESGRGPVCRCIECLAIEQGQQKLNMPFDVWIDRDIVEPPEHPDAPDMEPYDPRELGYKTAKAWFQVLARLKDDDPLVKRDPDTHGTISEDTREFLINIMGKDAHKRPSDLYTTGGDR